ncbi:MAG: lipid A phosphoethanolamine transferase [Alistipes sp.]|nr:lipid A phosphoethanolamine transferase [Alistipes sp.]
MRIGENKHSALFLTIAYLLSLFLPILILTFTEKNPFLIAATVIALPMGFYMMFSSLSSRSGVMVWWGFLFIFFSAFQIVLSYLFGDSIIAADMFLNLLTTNPGEATELLSNIYPSVILVVLIYIPLLVIASMHIYRKTKLSTTIRRRLFLSGGTMFLAGIAMLFGCWGEIRHVLRDELFPVNVSYNLGLSISEAHKISKFEQTSADFTYDACRDTIPQQREVYVLFIGEASRADSWSLYGAERQTNPLLSQVDDLCLFSGVTTQSNTTHKSVPMILSSVHTSEHDELYRRKGIIALFKEAGFDTYFISNQSPQGAMIDKLALEADTVEYLADPRMDMQLVDRMNDIISTSPSMRLFIVLHAYGSHFSYHQRYPREFARYMPDDDVAITRQNIEMIRNSYDNSILYTDYVLSEAISSLRRHPDLCSVFYFCSDHGEDLMDDERMRFLHSSPTVTYYQLHVASFAWMSPLYQSLFADKAAAVANNYNAPATTYSVFHTMADFASISSPYVATEASLCSSEFDYSAPRLYLDDHNNAVELDRNIGITPHDEYMFSQAGIEL